MQPYKWWTHLQLENVNAENIMIKYFGPLDLLAYIHICMQDLSTIQKESIYERPQLSHSPNLSLKFVSSVWEEYDGGWQASI